MSLQKGAIWTKDRHAHGEDDGRRVQLQARGLQGWQEATGGRESPEAHSPSQLSEGPARLRPDLGFPASRVRE